jgi:hypothetical protein
MKKALLVLAAVAMAASALAQGTIDFMNRNIPGANGGASYNVPLWVNGTQNGAVTPVGAGTLGVTVGLFEAGGTVPLVTSLLRSDTPANAAFFATATQTARTSQDAGTTPQLFVRAWTTSSGGFAAARTTPGAQWGEWSFTSQPLGGTPASGGLPVPTPGMTGWGPGTINGGFALELTPVPEPATVALGVLGVGALLLARRRKE